jgi:2-amino-4-hydroxy-6-hydroxymethyldihydropteridine diphosphokinase
MVNQALILLGSNMDVEINLEKALNLIAKKFVIEKKSSVIASHPVGNYVNDFGNMALAIKTNLSQQDCVLTFKEIEKLLGRTTESKLLRSIPIDIDLIFWNGKQVHSDYDQFFFVKQCIDQIK